MGKELLKYEFNGNGSGDSIDGNCSSGNVKGAKVILATAPSRKAMSSALEGLAVNRKLRYRCF
jgi:hypothetical protein